MTLPPVPVFRGDRTRRAVAVLCALVVLAAACNAWWFTWRTANPLIVSDNWYYLDRIVYPYAHGHLAPGDLLVKRSAFDHSQPLRRALLLLNYEWFDLDFRVEAVLGAVIGALNLLLLGWLARRELREGLPVSALAFAALAAVYLSLSATVVFTWSLLTLAFTNHLALFLWLAAVWNALVAGRPRALAAAAAMTLLVGLVADDSGLAATIAASLAVLLHAARTRQWRPARNVLLCILGGWGAYLLAYRLLAPAVAPSAAHGAGGQLAQLVALLPQAWTWVTVPLGSALVHRSSLRPWVGDDAEAVVAVVALLSAVAHLWFWRQAFVGRRNRPAFIAVVLMLLFYGLVAALLVGRVAGRGSDYLWQPRYALAYRWHLVALLLMLVAQAPALAAWGVRRRAWVVAPLVLLLLAQAGLSAEAWHQARYSRRWTQRAALQVLALAQDPAHAPKACVPQLTVCRFPPDRRARLVRFLEEHRLNVFSEQVRRRSDLPDAPASG